MKKTFITVCLTLAALLAQCFCHAQTIEKIVPIVSDDNIKLEVLFSNASRKTQDIRARVTSCRDGKVVWEGSLAKGKFPVVNDSLLTFRIEGIEAELWSPATPNLYMLEVSCAGSSVSSRIGFRKFEMADGQFRLNGKPIFLRGNAINPPNRGIPDELETSKEFARDYIRFLKGMNINAIRIPANQNWMDVCDEEGMMIFAGRYGRPRGGTPEAPPTDLEQAVRIYKEVELGPFTSHPSMVIYILSNETPHSGRAGELYREFFKKAYDELIRWDHTKQYICNAGYGLGRSADVYDVHRYWGWYYNSFLTYMNLRDMEMWQNPGRAQAITFTECVGNYTGIDGAFNLCSRTKQPGSQKSWTGHIPNDRQGEAALKYQAFVLKNATEMFRRFRSQNPRLAGIMPFTIIFHNWDGVSSFAQMKPKPAAYQYGVSYQPVLLSWESWRTNVFAGSTLPVVAHVVNDDDMFRDLTRATIVWALETTNRIPVVSGTVKLPKVPYFGTHRTPLEIEVPQDTPTGYYTLKGTILQEGKIISENTCEVFVAGNEWNMPQEGSSRTLKVYDPSLKCVRALSAAGIKHSEVSARELRNLKPENVLLIAENVWNVTLEQEADALIKFAARGGRIVCLRQDAGFDTSWLPVKVETLSESANDPTYLSPEYTYADGMNINIERPAHPIFEGLERDMFRLWSDYTDFDESKEGFPQIYPATNGYLMREADLTKVEIYANYSRNLSGTALCEIQIGKGSVILSGFDLTSRVAIDPVADRMMRNLLRYACSWSQPQPYKLVEKPIVWGDFASEDGIVTGANNGLVINPLPIIPLDQQDEISVQVDNRGYRNIGFYGGWNTRPGVQYMPYGRRPFAPFGYSKGGNDLVQQEHESSGTGYFLARVPQDRTKMVNILENADKVSIRVSIGINDMPAVEYTIPPRSKITVETALPAERDLKVIYSGDRRTAILRTEFL